MIYKKILFRVIRGTSCDTSEVSRISSAASRQVNIYSKIDVRLIRHTDTQIDR